MASWLDDEIGRVLRDPSYARETNRVRCGSLIDDSSPPRKAQPRPVLTLVSDPEPTGSQEYEGAAPRTCVGRRGAARKEG